MDLTRRDLVKAGMSAAALAAVPRPLLTQLGTVHRPVPPIVDPDVKELALRAVDAARSAGAQYADTRLTHTRTRKFRPSDVQDYEAMAVGVRALVNGYWGFASGPVWTKDEMDRLGAEAVHQAKANTLGKSRVVNLASTPVVRDGHWAMPVEIDPFEVSPYEIMDYLTSLVSFTQYYVNRRVGSPVWGPWPTNNCQFQVQEKAFASTEGSFCTQRLYLSEGVYEFLINEGPPDNWFRLAFLPAGLGWELYRGKSMSESMPALLDPIIDQWERDRHLPSEPVSVGRYDAVCSPFTVAELVNTTLGPATELDRALGYEANATGTSYISDPMGMIGHYEVGAPIVTLTANRSEPGGAATVQWDDEGVVPDEATLIKDGVLVDFQATRESAGWLAEYYRTKSTVVRSHGHAAVASGLDAPLQHSPNLRLAPGKEAHDFEALVAGMEKGIVIDGTCFVELNLDMDFQALNGFARPRMHPKVYRVSKGKRVAMIKNPALMFRSSDLWKGVLALGGAGSEYRFGFYRGKGEPEQLMAHSVTAPPAVFKQLTLIEATT